MRSLFLLILVFAFGPAHAALVDNGSYTTDSASGPDWLYLSATFDLNINDAQSANSGWRLATETEVQGLFDQLFPNFVETEDNTCSLPEAHSSSTSVFGRYSAGSHRPDTHPVQTRFGSTWE